VSHDNPPHKHGLCRRRVVSVGPSVCPFPSRSCILSKWAKWVIFRNFSPSGSHTILVFFPYQALWQFSDRLGSTFAQGLRGRSVLDTACHILVSIAPGVSLGRQKYTVWKMLCELVESVVAVKVCGASNVNRDVTTEINCEMIRARSQQIWWFLREHRLENTRLRTIWDTARGVMVSVGRPALVRHIVNSWSINAEQLSSRTCLCMWHAGNWVELCVAAAY